MNVPLCVGGVRASPNHPTSPPPPPPTQPSLVLGLKICNISQQQILNGERFKITHGKKKCIKSCSKTRLGVEK